LHVLLCLRGVMAPGSSLAIGDRNHLATVVVTTIAMVAFAANSVLCRLALAQTGIDPGSFTLVRIVSGALMLALLFGIKSKSLSVAGSWRAALALFAYAAAFSFAYVSLPAGVGALLLFGAVQATMVITGLVRGEHMTPGQWLGLVLALGGLAALVAPGVSAPPLLGTALMLAAGVAWGAYSLMGRFNTDPLGATTGNFLRAAPIAVVLALPTLNASHPTLGLIYAAMSGALASGVGYTIWYSALPRLSAAQGASVQLSVPVITAVGGTLFLAEAPSLRLVLASSAVLGGIALVIFARVRLQ
jgi:drug/metabolite transporter (DMT)-like permease